MTNDSFASIGDLFTVDALAKRKVLINITSVISSSAIFDNNSLEPFYFSCNKSCCEVDGAKRARMCRKT